MAHEAGEHVSHTKRIWKVFTLLSIVTIVEVAFGIWKPEFLNTKVAYMKLLNWIFIILTIYKAYLITWAFMHMEEESKGLRRSVVWTAIFLMIYLSFILLNEGGYVFDVFQNGHKSWDF